MQEIQETLRHVVQKNCHIADAVHAADYTLCIYLLKMREFYRWESGYAFGEQLPGKAIGDWLKQREQLWNKLEEAEFEALPLPETRYDPFDTERINQALLPLGLVYSGGLGYGAKPHFFLARLEKTDSYRGHAILIAGEEYARDISSPPAMTQGKTIFLRRESLRRLIWEKLEQWHWNEPDNAMARALQHYNFEEHLDTALDAMTAQELDSVLHHELGELMAGELLGPDWEAMLLHLSTTRAELMLRALRDHLADALSTLPALVQKANIPSIHFYFGNLTHMRKHLAPTMLGSYEKWRESGDLDLLKALIPEYQDHWSQLALQALQLYRDDPSTCKTQIESLIDDQRL